MKLTIEKFQTLYEIGKLEMDEFDKSILLVQALTGKSEYEIHKLSVKKYNKLCAEIGKSFELLKKDLINSKPQQTIKVNGKWYFLNYEITKQPMTAGRYVEVSTFSADVIGNLHRIIASMANPLQMTWKGFKLKKYDALDHERISDDMLKLDFNTAYQCCLFFCVLFKESMKVSESFLINQTEQKKEMEKNLMDFNKAMDGFITVNWYKNLKPLL